MIYMLVVMFEAVTGHLDTAGEVAQHLLDLVGFLWLLEDLRR